MNKKAFTLIELLVVIGIIAMIVAIVIPNYLSARQRASDTRKKSSMQELKNALRLYYNDFNTFPQAFSSGIGKFNYIKGCGLGGVDECPCTVNGYSPADFASGTNCDTVYMKRFPSDIGNKLGTDIYYFVTTTGEDFCLRGILDNKSDPDIAVSQARCATACGTNCSGSDRYCLCGD